MSRYQMTAQLTISVSSRTDFAAVGSEWLDFGSKTVVPSFRATVDAVETADESVLHQEDPATPLGAPRGVFGALTLSLRSGGSKTVVCTRQRWPWLRESLVDGDSAMLELSRLNEVGRRGEDQVWLSVDQDPWEGEPQSLLATMSFYETEALDNTDRFARRLGLLRAFAQEHVVSFGHVSYSRDFARTDLEVGLNLRHGRTIPLLASQARGYSWVTALNESLVSQLGSIEGLQATRVFSEVASLAGGSVWLQASPTWGEYVTDPERRQAVFRALAPILPGGQPRELPPASSVSPELLLELQNADSYR